MSLRDRMAGLGLVKPDPSSAQVPKPTMRSTPVIGSRPTPMRAPVAGVSANQDKVRELVAMINQAVPDCLMQFLEFLTIYKETDGLALPEPALYKVAFTAASKAHGINVEELVAAANSRTGALEQELRTFTAEAETARRQVIGGKEAEAVAAEQKVVELQAQIVALQESARSRREEIQTAMSQLDAQNTEISARFQAVGQLIAAENSAITTHLKKGAS